MKASGFTHQEIINLRNICKWYIQHLDKFKTKLLKTTLSQSETDALIVHFGTSAYSWETSQKTRNSDIVQIFERIPDLEQISKSFLKDLSKNKAHFKTLKALDRRIVFAKTVNQQEKEQVKRSLAEWKPRKPGQHLTLDDPTFKLIEEIGQRFEWRDHEFGHVGSPLRLLNILQGKHDECSEDFLYRIKLFFVYGSKGLFNEIAMYPELVEKINTKLLEKQKNDQTTWQLDTNLSHYLRENSSNEPVYNLGIYAKENNLGKRTRRWRTYEELKQVEAADLNHTYAEGERIAKGVNCKPEELTKRFRFQLYPAEEMAFFGTNTHLEQKEVERRKAFITDEGWGISTPSYNTPSFLESNLEYRKRTERISQLPGKHFFQMHSNKESDSPYFEAIDALGIPQYAGISGSTDQIFTLIGLLGIQSKKELMALRLIFIAWMGANEDHTAHEIMTALKSFGLEYTPSADYYKNIYPTCPSLVDEIEKAQQHRGYKLPDYYLSNEYVKQVLREKEETEQNTKVQNLLSHQKIILQGLRTYKRNYSLSDLFAKAKWEQQVDHLKSVQKRSAARIAKRANPPEKNKEKVLYKLNPESNMYERYKMPQEMFYQGSKKQSVSIVPPNGKIIPYVPFDWPDLNRAGLLYDGDKVQYKENHIYSMDANVDLAQRWKKEYTIQEIQEINFEDRLKKDSQEAVKFNRTMAHQVTPEELSNQFELFGDQFIHYNEVLASVNPEAIVGVFCFSRGLPIPIPGAREAFLAKVRPTEYHRKFYHQPLEHEEIIEFKSDADYDRYMRLMGMSHKLNTKHRFGKDVPLYEINTTTDTGLRFISRKDQIQELETILRDENGEIDGLIRVIKHQTDISSSDEDIKKNLQKILRTMKRDE